MHQLERVVDFLKWHLVRDQIVDVDLAVHVPVDDPRHVGAAAGAAEGRALPDAAGHQLEWPGLYFLPGACDPDDDRDTPAAMTALQRLAHQIHVADAFKAVVGTAVGQRHQVRYQLGARLLGIDEVRHAEFLRQLPAPRIDIDADDHVGAHHAGALDDVQSDAA